MIRYGFLFSALLSLLMIAGIAGTAQADTNLNDVTPMDSAALAHASGTGDATITSTVYGNTMGDAYSGNISSINVTNNSGLTTVVENTGNQVSIATATTINMNFH